MRKSNYFRPGGKWRGRKGRSNMWKYLGPMMYELEYPYVKDGSERKSISYGTFFFLLIKKVGILKEVI